MSLGESPIVGKNPRVRVSENPTKRLQRHQLVFAGVSPGFRKTRICAEGTNQLIRPAIVFTFPWPIPHIVAAGGACNFADTIGRS